MKISQAQKHLNRLHLGFSPALGQGRALRSTELRDYFQHPKDAQAAHAAWRYGITPVSDVTEGICVE